MVVRRAVELRVGGPFVLHGSEIGAARSANRRVVTLVAIGNMVRDSSGASVS